MPPRAFPVPTAVLQAAGTCLSSESWSRLGSQEPAKGLRGLWLVEGKMCQGRVGTWDELSVLGTSQCAKYTCTSLWLWNRSSLWSLWQHSGWGWMWAAPRLVQCLECRTGVSGLGGMFSLSGQSSSCSGCCIGPWKVGSARQHSLGHCLEIHCRVKMCGSIWRIGSSSPLLTCVMSFMVPQPARR